MNFEIFSFKLNPENKKVKLLTDYEEFCEPRIPEISAGELKLKISRNEKLQLIDVREPAEYAVRNIGGQLIPLKTLPDSLSKIEKNIPVIIHCQSGIRSKKAAELLMQKGYNNVVSLKGGLAAF
jgi:adenylyltransferase/sulfurtransferase